MNLSTRILEEGFHPSLMYLYDVVCEVQFSRFRLLIKKEQEVVGLEDWYLGKENDLEALLAKLAELYLNHDFLTNGEWRSVSVVSELEIHAVLPENEFEEALLSDYLAAAYPNVNLSDLELNYQILEKEAVVWGSIKGLNDFFRQIFLGQEVTFLSSAACMISYKKQMDSSENFCVLSDVFIHFCLHLPKSRLSRMIKMPLHHYNPSAKEENQLLVFGEVTPHMVVYKQLETGYSKVNIANFATELTLSSLFLEVPLHRYFLLLVAAGQKLVVHPQEILLV